ncbi:MAG: hypothetical protein JOZ73_13665 [Solirubrobacterales bacterium]|nr:hypothetical protein [Solirubrobacterales bacterium]
MRRVAVARGDDIFHRFTVVAIILTPSWIAGIHRVRPSMYLPINALAAALWAVGIGLGAYYIGSDIVEWVGDIGWAMAAGLGVLVVAGLITGIVSRRRHAERRHAARELSG